MKEGYCKECGQRRHQERPPWADAWAWDAFCRFTEPSKWLWAVFIAGAVFSDLGFPERMGMSLGETWGGEEWVMLAAVLYMLASIPVWAIRGWAWCWCWWQRRKA